MNNKEKIELLEQVLEDYENSYSWEFKAKVRRSIDKLRKEEI